MKPSEILEELYQIKLKKYYPDYKKNKPTIVEHVDLVNQTIADYLDNLILNGELKCCPNCNTVVLKDELKWDGWEMTFLCNHCVDKKEVKDECI